MKLKPAFHTLINMAKLQTTNNCFARQILPVAMLFLVATITFSCGGTGISPEPAQLPLTAGSLPAMAELADLKTSSDLAVRNGAEYSLAGGDAVVFGTSVVLNTTAAATAWSLYQFALPENSDVDAFTLHYSGSGWLAIADYNLGRWQFSQAGGSGILSSPLGGMGVSSPAGNCFIACIANVDISFEVQSVELETTELADFALAWALPDNGWAPLEVNLSAFGTEDVSGITGYSWDLDGDGVNETDATGSGGYASTTFATPGTYTIGFQATAGDGSISRDSVEITVRDPAASTVDYNYVYDDTQVKRIDIAVSQVDWDAMWVDPLVELEVSATANIFGEQLASPVGFKMKGNSSLWMSGEKKSWKLDIDKYDGLQEFQNLKMLILNNNWNDPSQCREKMAFDLMQAAGLAASSVSYVELFLDIGGVGAEYWGVYSMVERVDKKFLANKVGDKTGNLYKAGDRANLLYLGSNYADYQRPLGDNSYLMETNEDTNDGSDVVHLIDVLNNSSLAELPVALEAVFDVDSFLRYYAVNKLACTLDDYACVGHNYYIYHNPSTGKFSWIPWDLNGAYGVYGVPPANAQAPLYEVPNAGPQDGAPMFERLMEIEAYRIHLAAYIDLLRRNLATPENIRASAKHWHDQLAPYVLNETKIDYFSFGEFDQNWLVDVVNNGQSGNPKLYFGITNLGQARAVYVDTHLLTDL